MANLSRSPPSTPPTIQSHIISSSTTLPASILQQIASTGVLDEISNYPGAVRHHIYHSGNHRRDDIASRRSLLFFVYQTGRDGPQNGFRLCIVHNDYRLASPDKGEGHAEDDVDRLEAAIPQGHVEAVVLGRAVVGENEASED